ncbi:hypothetical protein [Armatimonas sp.]|uniref:hypothetical protein n=1 Tax=Armatimonas sp. TaxID=1872638 RepID=UPI00286ABF85|nr:hypothetical protein [Armatimonas sp.]
MATKFTIAYTRRKKDWQVDSTLRRAGATATFMQSLDAKYQAIPDMETSRLQSATSDLQSSINELNVHLEAIAALLPALDTKTETLDKLNKASYGTLRSLLKGKPEAQRLDQAVLPTPRKQSTKPTV